MGCANVKGPKVNPLEVDLSHFEIHRVIGHGGFGKVRACEKISPPDKSTWYAMKSLKKTNVLKSKTGIESVITELKALSELQHPCLCNAHYAFQDECFLYLVMDLALGGDLRYHLRHSPTGKFSESQTCFYIAQILEALVYLHTVDYLHRDVKPENILLTSNGYIKLTDMGISKKLKSIEHCRSTSGTHGYMAPELYQHGHVHGSSAEWFSLGVTMHEMLSGRRPYPTSFLQTCKGVEMSELKRSAPADDLGPVDELDDLAVAVAANRKSASLSFLNHANSHQYQDTHSGASIAAASTDVNPSPRRSVNDISSKGEPISRPCVLFCRSLIDLDAHTRLGGISDKLLEASQARDGLAVSISTDGSKSIKEHEFLAEFDFEGLLKQTIAPPFKPNINQANCDTGEFDIREAFGDLDDDVGDPPADADQVKFSSYVYDVHNVDVANGGKLENSHEDYNDVAIRPEQSLAVMDAFDPPPELLPFSPTNAKISKREFGGDDGHHIMDEVQEGDEKQLAPSHQSSSSSSHQVELVNFDNNDDNLN